MIPEGNDLIRLRIILLEKVQPRVVREALLGVAGAMGKLQAIDTQIAALRAQLTPEN